MPDTSTLKRIVEPANAAQNIAQSIEQGWQMPARCYSDPRIHEIEQDAIFKKAWQYVGRANALNETGDYLTARLGDVPIVVVRDDTGKLHGHVNACRHRLHPVALGDSGCKQLFQCRYHGWTFTHDGTLRSAPGQEQCQGFDKGALGLVPVRVEVYKGLIFANVDMQAEDLQAFLGNTGELLQELDIDIMGWEHAGTFVYDIDADWKLFSENSLECYHCPLVHQTTFATYFGTQPKDYITREFDNVLSHHAPVTKSANGGDAEGMKGFRFVYVWPSTTISADDYVGTIARITALGPQRTRFTVDMFVAPGADPKEVEQWLDVYDRTFNEDKEVVAAQQQGYRSGMVPQGRLMAHREASIQMFQRRTWAALRLDPRLSGLNDTQPQPLRLIPVEKLPVPEPTTPSGIWEGELVISARSAVANGVTALTLSNPAGPLPTWAPGAHIDLILPNGLERQYSLCGPAQQTDQWTIAVLREPASRGGSAFVHEQLMLNQRIRVRGPRNHFPMPEAEHYRFVAGGIGITPILAMIRQAEAQGKDWQLLYGGRSRDSMAFVEELERYGDRVIIAPQDSHGLLDLEGYLAQAPAHAAVCACGPGALLDALARHCAGYETLQLHVERFAIAPVDQSSNTEFEVELRKSGIHLTVGKHQSVLEAVREAGVTVYSSCQNGVCGTCETPVLEGSIDHRDGVLSSKEQQQGKSMMLCVSRCTSKKLVLDL